MKEEIIQWIKDWFKKESGNAEGIVIGISGGKDSTIVAKLCVEAIGKEKVFGVLMPNGEQKDIEDSKRVCEILGIEYIIIDISASYKNLIDKIEWFNKEGTDWRTSIKLSNDAIINIAPRIRMTTLYAIAQTKNYRVAGTGNATEKALGYFTKWGDGAHDFNPIGSLTCTEVIELGLELGLPEELVKKTPSDGLTGKSDEESFGFSYSEIDKVINGDIEEGPVFEYVDSMFNKNEHKLNPIPTYGFYF